MLGKKHKQTEQSAPQETENVSAAPEASAENGGKPKKFKRKKRFTVKKLILLIVLIAAAAGICVGVYLLFFAPANKLAMTGETTYGSLDRAIEGTGSTLPAESQSATPVSSSDITAVYVSAGDTVAVGDLLFSQDDSEVDDKISSYNDKIDDYNDQISDNEDSISSLNDQISDYNSSISDYYEDISDTNDTITSLTVRSGFAGRVTYIAVDKGDTVKKDAVLATVTNDDVLEVTLYYSYAYENDIAVGDPASVSVGEKMQSLSGTVSAVNYVSMITDEGMKCFSVTVSFTNPGSLTSGMTAACVINGDIYPVGDGETKYASDTNIKSPVDGEITEVLVADYQDVGENEVLFRISATSYEDQIANLRKQITSAQEKITSAQKQIEKLEKKNVTLTENIADVEADIAEAEESRDDFNVKAEISGKVMYVNVEEGDSPNVNMTAVTIYNLDSMLISVNFDELDVEYLSVGTKINITQTTSSSTKTYDGEITTLNPEANSSNGVATFPATITIASNGELSAGVNVSYSVDVGDSEESVLAPVSALKSADDAYYLVVKADKAPDNAVVPAPDGIDVPDGYYAVKVEVGTSNSDYVRITSGIGEGETLFLRYRQSAPSGGDSTSDSGSSDFQMPGDMQDMFTSGNMPNFGGGNSGSGSSRGSGSSGGMPSGGFPGGN